MDELAPGATPALDADEARWAAAWSVVLRSPSPTARQRLRRHTRRTWSWMALALLLVVAATVLLASLVDHRRLPGGDPSTAWQVTGLVLQGGGLLTMAGYWVIAVRVGAFRGAWSSPMAVLDRAQRRSLRAQVRGQEPVDPRRLPLARDLAERLALQRFQLVLLTGLLLQQVGLAVGSRSAVIVAFAVAFLVGYPVLGILLGRDTVRGARFLRAHPDPDAG